MFINEFQINFNEKGQNVQYWAKRLKLACFSDYVR